jgi:hypothetical protein
MMMQPVEPGRAMAGGADGVETAIRPSRRGRLLRSRLTYARILAWADAHRARTGNWPTKLSGNVHGEKRENWNAITSALYQGFRGLPGGCTLAQLLAVERGVFNRFAPPPLRVGQILEWADAHHARHGAWPLTISGVIPHSGGESWAGINNALSGGKRDLPGGGSLSKLLASRRAMHESDRRPKLAAAQVLGWADDFYAARGRWPSKHSGRIPNSGGETWRHVDWNLRRGTRGLPASTSLAEFLNERHKPGAVDRG